ncbi:MAG: 4a-hydroxytetrahydrobiopterin dehydratase [Melioribacter sp.]|uniref:4a-hydroxytetrahydrobiopterin dehydratase n=1 Tax=Rosettibacter primus TaxID=3111523 RepID=UPI00247E0B24|nr:4a-hydroxytetrahydrobiopterin dehydratase [Melioribacter sp.]
MKVLSAEEVKEKLNDVIGWEIVDNKLIKEYKLKNFSGAISFIVRIGIEAEKLDHHPDLYLYGWNNVKVILFTHSANGITENDINLAHKIEQIVK